MISPNEVVEMIQNGIPDADVEIVDRTGERNHYIVKVVSREFAELGPLDRNRRVYYAVNPAIVDGRLHAIEIKTAIPG